uniref:Uncharacterized protein n=1 Tax=Oryza nivara TaxID=4536 RepID=A0A0E0GKY8_ORYNI
MAWWPGLGWFTTAGNSGNIMVVALGACSRADNGMAAFSSLQHDEENRECIRDGDGDGLAMNEDAIFFAADLSCSFHQRSCRAHEVATAAPPPSPAACPQLEPQQPRRGCNVTPARLPISFGPGLPPPHDSAATTVFAR